MIKLDVLKGRIVENRTNYTECSKAIGVSLTTFSAKMNKQREFSVSQATKLSEHLKLSNEEKFNIFLT